MKEEVFRNDSEIVVTNPVSNKNSGGPLFVETFLIDEDGILTYSKGFDLACFGFKPGSSSGLSVFDLFQEDLILLDIVNRALNGEAITTEATIDGITYATSFSPVFDCNGKVKNVVGVSCDITESKKASETVQKSEFRLRTLFNSAHDAIFTMNRSTFLDCNEATLRIFQCTRDQIIGQTPIRFSPLRQSNGRLSEEVAPEKIAAAFKGEPQFFEWRHTRYDGTPFEAEVSLNVFHHDGEQQLQAIVRDISERKRTDETNKKLATVVNATTNIVLLVDVNGEINWVNPAFTRLTGYTLEEVVGKKPGSLLRGPKTDRITSDFIREKFRAGLGFKNVEIINYTKTGGEYWVSIEVQPIRDASGKVVQWVAIESDITERKATQQALLDRNEELIKINTELDRFVYSASHDLRAPIASLLGLVEVARLEKDMDNMTFMLDMQEKSLLRLDRFIKDIVDHSRNTRLPVECEKVSFEKLVHATLEQFQYMENVSKIRKMISIDQSQDFYTAPSRLEIIFNNLISNSLKYADLRKDDPCLKVLIKSNSQSAEIRVIDNGEGIPKDSKDKVFDMFFRASANGTGSGLGLYIVKEAVQKIGGTIRVESNYGIGSEFVVIIPNRNTESQD
ncbi:MAG: PAS domain-containing sensor histidine kinase [Cyclobacteriaceae bacterium]|nr:PAS domain-containing sensor histidine kinase [Cyclobacteriaceae bacterium]